MRMHTCRCIQKGGRPASAIITEKNEQQATSGGWGETDRNTIVSQRKEGKRAQRKTPTQSFPSQWGIRSKTYQNQWRL